VSEEHTDRPGGASGQSDAAGSVAPAGFSAPSAHTEPPITPAEASHRFNLSSWTLRHQALVVFILALGATPFYATLTAGQQYQNAHVQYIRARASRLADTAALFDSMGNPPVQHEGIKLRQVADGR
jgi:hypothetical protein